MPIRRGKAGTDLGGQFIGPKSIAQALIRELSARGHAGAAKDLRTNPPKLTAPKKRAISRFKPSERELKGHSRASADASRLRDRIATLDEDLRAPQHEGGRMSHPAERDKARKTRAELQRQLAELEPRVAAGDRNRQQNPDMYGDAPTPGDVPDGAGPAPAGAGALSSDPAVRKVQLENRVIDAYARFATTPGAWMPMQTLRRELSDLDRSDVDAALEGMALRPGVHLIPWDNRKALSAADRAAALHFGGDANDALRIEDPSPRPLPSAQPRVAAHEPLSSDPAVRQVQIDNRVRQAYADVLAGRSGTNNRWVGLADLRAQMGDGVSRPEQDAALRRLEQADGVNVVPESNQKTLTQADRDAAVTIGDQQKHAITMDDPSPRPLPAHTPTPPDGTGPVPVVPGAAASKWAAASAATAASADILRARSIADIRAVGRELGVPLPKSLSDRDAMAEHVAKNLHAFGHGDATRGIQDALVEIDSRRPAKPPRKAAAKVAAAKAAKRPASETAALVDASTTAEEADAHLEGLSVTELRAVAAEMDGVRVRSGKERMRADIVGASKGVVGTIDFAVRAIPSNPSIPKVAKADLPGSAPSPRLHDLGAMSVAELRAVAVNDDPDLEQALASRSMPELRRIADDANVPVPKGQRGQKHTIGGVRAEMIDTVLSSDRRTGGRAGARLLGVANATPRDKAPRNAAAKVRAAKAANPDVRPDPMAEHMAVQRAAYEVKPFGEPEMPPAAPPKRKAAARVKAAKAAAEPPDAVAAKIRAAASEEEARQYLNGLTLAQLKEVAKLTGGSGPRKAELIDAIVYNGVGFRIESEVLRSRGESRGPRPEADGSQGSPIPAPRKAADRVRAATPDGWSPANMTTVGADPADVAGKIDRTPNESAILEQMTGMTVADLRKVARELSMPLPKPPPGGRWTPDTLRQYIATVHLRDRNRWSLR